MASEQMEEQNLCTVCQVNMGPMNPRQLCGKTYCMYQHEKNEIPVVSQNETTEIYLLNIVSEHTCWEIRAEDLPDNQTYIFSSKEKALLFLKSIYPALNTKKHLKTKLLDNSNGIRFVRHSSQYQKDEDSYDRYAIEFKITLKKASMNPIMDPQKTYFRRSI